MEPLPQPALHGHQTSLLPMSMSHCEALSAAASDGQLWDLKVTFVPGQNGMAAYISSALRDRDAGTVMPFSICLKQTGQIVGTTRYWKIDQKNRSLEIGHTWLARSFQRTF